MTNQLATPGPLGPVRFTAEETASLLRLLELLHAANGGRLLDRMVALVRDRMETSVPAPVEPAGTTGTGPELDALRLARSLEIALLGLAGIVERLESDTCSDDRPVILLRCVGIASHALARRIVDLGPPTFIDLNGPGWGSSV